MRIACVLLLVLYISHGYSAVDVDDEDSLMHNFAKIQNRGDEGSINFIGAKLQNERERDTDFWLSQALGNLNTVIKRAQNKKPAKNLILFLGDGMGVSTHTAARIYQGQLNRKSGEENSLFFERFPYTGLSKTYCVDAQVADSACTSTAYTNGVKASIGTMGVNAKVSLGDCNTSKNASTHTDSILQWAQDEGKSTGVVSTARVTHASPGGLYSHIAHRDWECDSDRPFGVDCQDIASQLIHNAPGNKINVILGGGLSKFKLEKQDGARNDQCLIDQYRANRNKNKDSYEVVYTKAELNNIAANRTDFVLGLFAQSHMNYQIEKFAKEPSLTEMTRKAIEILSKNSKGFYLFVEGGRIDMAHHSSKAKKALTETIEFDKAIQTAYNMTSDDDTLIVVTADHSHTFTIAGYPERGNDLLGKVRFGGKEFVGEDDLPYLTLGYNNGPGYALRRNINYDDTYKKDYAYPSGIPLDSETHGGEDVAVFSTGPCAHLLVGNFEQNYIPVAMAYAGRIGPGKAVEFSGATMLAGPALTLVLSLTSLLLCNNLAKS